MSKKTFRVLLRNLMYLRNFEAPLRVLAEQGHHLHITSSIYDRKVPKELQERAQRLEEDFPNVTVGFTHEREDFWGNLESEFHSLRNFLRYQRPEYRNAPALAGRAEKRVAKPIRMLFKLPGMRSTPLLALWSALARVLDMAIPADRTIRAELAKSKPDALIVSPVVDLGSEQNSWLRAAKAEGVPSCLMVASWDNLTNKGLILTPPDKVVLWNDFQKREAVTMHGIPAEAVVATGAQLYDDWFERSPTSTYEDFCARFGFDPNKPTILYCGSSIFIARNEAEFVRKWLTLVRQSDSPALSEANILVRPHPMHQVPFEDLDVTEWGRVAVHPRAGGMPVNEDARADYFDAIYHCSAVVGINTSALIEASIQGKRSFTVSDPSYAKTQEGTLHFRYLIEGGILQRAPTFEEHQAQLEAELAGSAEESRTAVSAFVESFLRPNGLDKPASPQVAQAILDTAEMSPKAKGQGPIQALLSLLMLPLAALVWLRYNLKRVTLDFAVRVLRRANYSIARAKRMDGTELLGVPMPLDEGHDNLAILATAPKEKLTGTWSLTNEPHTVQWIKSALGGAQGEECVFYDIGAHVGIYSLLAASTHGKTIRVFAFEPSYSTHASLCRNIQYNGLDKVITPVATLLGRNTGLIPFKYRDTQSGATGHVSGDRNLEAKDLKETKAAFTQLMPVATLDRLVGEFGMPKPTHVKLDVEGQEVEILEGATDLLSQGAILSLMVNIQRDKDRDAVVALMATHGYAPTQDHDKNTEQGGRDILFSRP